jgi:hypothetical protein
MPVPWGNLAGWVLKKIPAELILANMEVNTNFFVPVSAYSKLGLAWRSCSAWAAP